MSPHPRPILKRLSSATKQSNHALPFATCGKILSPHVHFPPTPSIVASTHPVHSPQTYDRQPIIVSPNSCVLPQRGDRKLHSPPADFEVEHQQRGRSRNASNAGKIKGSYFHPRAYEACEPESLDADDSLLSPPALDHDSPATTDYDSDYDSDSDVEVVTTPPDPQLSAQIVVSQSSASPPASSRENSPYKGRYVSSSRMHLHGKSDEFQRPRLVRTNSRPSVYFGTGELCSVAHRDEGCLGGF